MNMNMNMKRKLKILPCLGMLSAILRAMLSAVLNAVLSTILVVHVAMANRTETDIIINLIESEPATRASLTSMKGQNFLKGLGIKVNTNNPQEQQTEFLKAIKEEPLLAEIALFFLTGLSAIDQQVGFNPTNPDGDSISLSPKEDPYDLQSVARMLKQQVELENLTKTQANTFMDLAKQAATSQNTGENLRAEIISKSLMLNQNYLPSNTQQEIVENINVLDKIFSKIFSPKIRDQDFSIEVLVTSLKLNLRSNNQNRVPFLKQESLAMEIVRILSARSCEVLLNQKA